MRSSFRLGALAVLLVLCAGSSARAAFHLWTLNEIFSTADGSVQFIEYQTTFPSEGFVNLHTVRSNTNLLTLNKNLPGNTANKTFLIGTASLVNLGITPDFTISPNFFSINGDTINWAEGSNIFSFTGAQFPKDGILSLQGNKTTAVNSPKNYAGLTVTLPEPAGMLVLAGMGMLLVRRRK